jgi:methylmalonyl-CoA epimerase
MKIFGLHHVAIATNDITKHNEIFENIFGLKIGDIETNPANNLKLSFFNFGNADVEFLEPLDRDSTIAKFLEKKGPGIHHICILVDDIANALEELKAKNIKLVDQNPRQGAEGSLIAFIHPDSTGGILIELKEEKY